MPRSSGGGRKVLTPYEILAVAVFGDIAAKIVEKLDLERKVIASGLAVHPVKLVSKALLNTMLSAAYLTLVALLVLPHLPLRLAVVAGFAMAMVPPLLFISPIVRVLTAASSRSERILHELPFLSIHMTILARSGVGVQQMVERIVASGLYKEVTKELARALSLTRTLGYDIVQALDEVAGYTPNKHYADLIRGLVAAVRMRANPADYLSRAAETILTEYRLRLEKVKQVASIIGMVYGLVLIGMLFLNLIQTTSIVPNLRANISPHLYALLAMGFMPLITLLLAMVLYRRVPKLAVETNEPLIAFLTYLPLTVALGTIVFIAFTPLFGKGPAASAALTVALAIPSLIAAKVFNKAASEEELVDHFVSFLHELTTERRQGLPLEHIIDTMPYSYGPFNSILRKLKIGIRLGLPPRAAIEQAFAGVTSRIMRFLANLLADAIVLGAANEQTLQQMESLVAGLKETISAIRTELRSISIVPYALLLVEAVSIVIFFSMGMMAIHRAAELGLAGVRSEYVAQQEMMMMYFMAGTTLSAWLGGFMVGTMRRQNIWAGFLHSALLSIMITAAFLISPFIQLP